MNFRFTGPKFYNPATGVFTDDIFIDSGLVASSSSSTEEVAIEAGFAFPAFRDGHAHPLFAGREALGPVVSGAKSIEGIQEILRQFRIQNPTSRWIEGGAYDRSLIAGGRFLAVWIDEVISDVPVVLHASDHHTIWVNSKALELLPEPLPSLSAGSIDLDESSRPSGVLREPPAMNILLEQAPKATLETEIGALEWADGQLAEMGIVQAQDAWITKGMTEVYIAAVAAKRLVLDYNLAFKIDPGIWKEALEVAVVERQKVESLGSDQLQAHTVKFFADGVFGSGTAAVLEPYLDDHSHGEPLWEDSEFFDACTKALELGFQLHIHAIGDAGVRQALNAIEHAQGLAGMPKLPSVIAHAELIASEDIPRFAAIGVIANMQPLWAQADGMLLGCQPRLGMPRIDQMYRMRDLISSGATLAFGSDWPVSSPNPLTGMATAMYRTTAALEPAGGWMPKQAVSAAEAISGYSDAVAEQLGQAAPLRVGSPADFVVCDTNILTASDAQLREAKILATFKSGTKIYG